MTTVEPILKVEDIDYKHFETRETPVAVPLVGATTAHLAPVAPAPDGLCRAGVLSSEIEEG